MSPAKIKEMFEVLCAACHRQFGFNTRQVMTGMRYVGTEGHGKDLVHVFRDAGTHSQVVLKNTFATLREKHGEKPHWTDAEKAHYKMTDAQIDAELAAKQAELDYVRSSPLYLEHRGELLSHYKDWPEYVAGSVNPREAARALLGRLSEAQDAQLAAFSAHLKSSDLEHLVHLLLAPCHIDIEERKASA